VILFPNQTDLSEFIFRITDNGGETADRFTIMTCDGDYFTSSTNPYHPQGVGMWGEGFDPQIAADNVEAGTERDLRWTDLPEVVRTCVWRSLNDGFADWLGSFTPPIDRKDAEDSRSDHDRSKWAGQGVYGVAGAYMVRREAYPDVNDASEDLGPYADLATAVRVTLPDVHDLAGDEYQSTRDIFGTEGEDLPLWDRDEDPPVIDEDNEKARVVIKLERPDIKPGDLLETVAWFATMADAVNYLGTDKVDPDLLEAGAYTIDDLDDPDAKEED
jgi:hypothetical protein